MCTKAEVEDAISSKIKPLETEVSHIKGDIVEVKNLLQNMPCQKLMERVLRVEINQENLEKLRTQDKADIDKLYGMSRANETGVATLTEQNAGQDKISARTWAIILIVLSLIFNIAGYVMK